MYVQSVNWEGSFYTDLVNMPFQTAKAHYQMSDVYYWYWYSHIDLSLWGRAWVQLSLVFESSYKSEELEERRQSGT